jgi:hypothetical protein
MNYATDKENAFMDDYFIPANLMAQNPTMPALENPKPLAIFLHS